MTASSVQIDTAQLGGSGKLDWTASSDQPWLTLSADQGSVEADGAPATLTLSADPTDLAAGQSYVAHLTLTKPANGNEAEQTIVIPVALSIGNV